MAIIANVSGMLKRGGGLAREMADVGMSELVRQIEYKAEWRGRTHVKVDRFFASSKTCSCCGHKLDELQLDAREWICPKCGTEHDRDINAAINILNFGLSQISPATGRVTARGGESSGFG